MSSLVRLAVAAVLAVGVAGLARADDKPAKDKPSKPEGKAVTDAEFVMMAAQGGMAEVEMSKLALERAASPDVKKFAQKMVDDHTKSNKELMDAAKAANVPVPDKLDAEHQKHVDMLKDLKAREFDVAYMKHQVKHHDMAVELFMKAAKEVKTEQLRAFAEKSLPTLKEHQDMAKKINDDLGKQKQ